jgi:hypothetical protein
MTADRDALAELLVDFLDGLVEYASPRDLGPTRADAEYAANELADYILAAGWHPHHAPICQPAEHVMYEHCGVCGEIPEAVGQ